MAWLNVSVLAGLTLLAVPVLLHLAMRQKPKPYVFPALRFVQQRSETNKRQLRLRHWVLMTLRCLAIAFLVLLLARPSVASAAVGDWLLIGLLGLVALVAGSLVAYALLTRKGPALIVPLAAACLVLVGGLAWLLAGVLGDEGQIPIGNQEAPVSAVLVCDTAPRMTYRHENRTRLQATEETARRLVRELPRDSQIAVLTSQPAPTAFAVDRSAALKQLEQLREIGTPRSLRETLDEALRLASEGAHSRKEIYVFSDLTRAAWERGSRQTLVARLAELKNVTLYVIDVGVDDPRNTMLSPPELSTQTLAGQGLVELQVDVDQTGPEATRTIELLLEETDATRPFLRDGKPVEPPTEVRDRQTVEMKPNTRRSLAFTLVGLPPGTHHGRIQCLDRDALALDDTRYFTVVVRQPWRMLVVAEPPTDTTAWTAAVAPQELARRNKAAFEVIVARPGDLAEMPLDTFQAVCLLDPPPLVDAAWERLAAYVRGGGGLGVFLGAAAEPAARFAGEAAVEVLGLRPTLVFRAAGARIAPERYEHPILAPLAPFASSIPWDRYPVFLHWGIGDLADDVQVVLRYSNREPALVERLWGEGRVLVMTTPITEPDRPPGRQAWNELAGPNDWPRFVLVNQMAEFLVGGRDATWNYLTGQTALLENQADRYPAMYQLLRPNGELQTIRAVDGEVLIPWTEYPGIYRLKGDRGGTVLRGFAANLPAEYSQLDRLAPNALDEYLGEGRYQLARNADELERVQGTERAGREFYPFLAVLLALVLGLEQTLANRFYKA